MKKNYAAFFLLIVSMIFFAAKPVCAGIEGDVYRVPYECRDLKGNLRWKAVAELRHKEGDIYNITEKMEGVYYGFKGRISWVSSTDFLRTKDTVKPLNLDQRIFDSAGKLIATQKQEFDYDNNTVTCVHKDLVKNTTSEKKFKFSKDIINRMVQGVYVQKFLENGETSKEMQLMSPEPELYNMRLSVVDKEDVKIDGQMRKTYKLLFDPMLGFFNFVKVFLPKAYVWHSAVPIYELLKYQGIENSVSSPEVTIVMLDKDTPKTIPLDTLAKSK